MDSAKLKRLHACLEEVGEILFSESDPAKLQDLEGIETTVRSHLIEHVGPALALFLSEKSPKQSGVGFGR